MKVKKGDTIRDKYGGIGKVINFYIYDKKDFDSEANTVVEYECLETYPTKHSF